MNVLAIYFEHRPAGARVIHASLTIGASDYTLEVIRTREYRDGSFDRPLIDACRAFGAVFAARIDFRVTGEVHARNRRP